ncbi:probable peptidyl-tRNA hydrolase isoform X2 [Bombina bombina]|uniref:probable peptidyl-tRNA hydrolase isoform X2 n=1 Tax=Bombina bombina TaxID=8345 RepID=UPI00235AAF3A|nr:probable peptidyl-tRNA hydrolase isoform X2 [Bombina bombina]
MKAERSMRLLRLCSITSARHMSEAAARHGAGHQLLMVVGLGNYGMSGTRHNVGMDALNLLARRLNIAELWKKDKQCGADIIQSGIGQARLVLLKPRHFMNINGKSVGSAAGRFCVIPENICLLHDDLDKPLGKLSLKFGGSARGHNGVRSCIDSLQSDECTFHFCRAWRD